MKKIAFSILLIIIGLFGLDASFSFLIKENRNIKVSNAVKGEMDYDILFHGPCEPLFTIDASAVDSMIGTKSYNYALRHTDFADNLLHLHLYLKANKKPKQVYLYVTPESFDLRFNTFHTYRFAPYLEDSLVAKVVKNMDPDYYAQTNIPFMRFAFYNSYKIFDAIQGLKHYIKGKDSPYFKDGHISHPNNEFYTKPDGYIAPEHLVYAANLNVAELTDSSLYYELYEERQSFNWDANRAKYLTQLFELCHQHEVELILYESPAYAGAVKDQPNRKLFLTRTDSIAKSHNSEYLVFNDKNITIKKSNFVCPLILSVKGTAPFLKIFSDSIRKRLH